MSYLKTQTSIMHVDGDQSQRDEDNCTSISSQTGQMGRNPHHVLGSTLITKNGRRQFPKLTLNLNIEGGQDDGNIKRQRSHLRVRSNSTSSPVSPFVRRLTELNLDGAYSGSRSYSDEGNSIWTFIPPRNTNDPQNEPYCNLIADNATNTTIPHGRVEKERKTFTNAVHIVDDDTEKATGSSCSERDCRSNEPDISLLRQNSVQKRALQICRKRRRKIKRKKHNSDVQLQTELRTDDQESTHIHVEHETSCSQNTSPDYTNVQSPTIIAYLTTETESGEKIVFPCRQNSIQSRSWLKTQKHRQRRHMLRSQTT